MAQHRETREGQEREHSPREREIDVIESLVREVAELKRRVGHLETLEREGSFVALDKEELTVAAPSVTLNCDSTISAAYIALKIVMYVRTDRATTFDQIAVRFNSDTGANYDFLVSQISHSGVLATAETIATNAIQILCVGDTAPADVFSGHEMIIPDYAGANEKSFRVIGERKVAESTGSLHIVDGAGWWRNTDPITKIDLTPLVGPNFIAGSRFYLFGLKKNSP